MLTTGVSLIVTFSVLACGVCGGGASNQYFGLLPQSKGGFAGLQYQLRDFTGQHTTGSMSVNTLREYYNALQLWGRYSLGDRIQLFAFLPYIVNSRFEIDNNQRVNGIGDATILANYCLTKRLTDSKLKHTVLVGGGVKLPTGKYDNAAISKEDGLPNMQAGTKSLDVLFNTNYTIEYEKNGINLDASYAVTTPNTYQYKFGNRLQFGLQGYRYLTLKALNIVPLIGGRFENTACDYENYATEIRNTMTGGTFVYLSAGFQCYYKNVGFQFNFHKPVYQKYADRMVLNNYKLDSGIYIIFK